MRPNAGDCTLVLASAVQRAAQGAARRTRDAILAVPDRIAALLAAETDAARVYAILHAELAGILRALPDALTQENRADG